MSERMRFILDGDDRLSPVLDRAGDSATRLHRRLDGATRASSSSVRAFTREANGQLRDLQGRFVSVAHAARLIQDSDGRWRDLNGRFIASATAARRMTAVTTGLPPALRAVGDAAAETGARMRQLDGDTDSAGRTITQVTASVNGRLRDSSGRFLSAAGAVGSLGDAAAGAGSKLGGMGAAIKAAAAAAGLSLLPAMGALVPMMAGAGLAAGTLKLGFDGVGEALDQAGEDQEKYQELLKKLGPEQRELTKELASMKGEFKSIGKDIQKAMLPGFTKAVKDAGPVVEILGDAMTELGKGFGKAAEGAGRLFQDSGFQKDLRTNLDLGRRFVGDMMSGFGRLGRAFLDFGAKSGPTLTSLSTGFSDLLGRGLPGMFQGLERGIGGSAKFFDGLFSMVNQLLPALGRLSGEVARVTGPYFAEFFKILGGSGAGAMDAFAGALRLLAPVFRDVTYGLKTIRDIAALVGPTLVETGSQILNAFSGVGSEVNEAAGPLQRLNQVVNNNKIGILEAARIFGGAVLEMVNAAVQHTPTIIQMFRLASTGVLTAIDGMVSGLAMAFGHLPIVGDKLKDANKSFDKFKGDFLSGLDSAEKKARGFAAEVGPRLKAGELRLNISNWQQQIATAKKQMKSVPPSKRAALQAKIDDLQEKVRRAKGQLASVKQGKPAPIRANDADAKAKSRSAKSAINGVKQSKPAGIRGTIADLARKVASAKGLLNMIAPGITVPIKAVVSGLSSAKKLLGFAKGGRPKPGQLAWVGEEGPELMLFRGDEEIFDHRTSMSMVSGLGRRPSSSAGSNGGGMAGIGIDVGQGLAAGISDSIALVTAAARRMADAVTAGVREELQIASPSKKMQALAKDIGKGLITGLTGSRDKIKATAKDLAKDIWAAFSGSKDNRLVAMVNKQTKKLLDLASQRDKIAAKIRTAKEYASSVTSTARRQAGLANLGMEESEVTAGGIKGGLRKKLEQIRRFTGYIKELAKRGLNKSLLKQILDMGPEQGYAYASALAGADKSTFNEINSLQKKIDADTKSLGRIGADRLYDSGKNASKGFLKGLESQQDAIEKLMMKIAKGMQKAIKKALGIKSPSTVMARLGSYSTEGLARGLVGGMPVLDKALAEVSGRVAATQPVLGRPAAVAGRGGGTVIHIHVDGAIVDQLGVARAVRQALLDLKRTNGGTELGIA